MTDTAHSHSSILHIDCFSGASGDMILAALLDMGLPLDVVQSAVAKLPLSGFELEVRKEKRQSIEATRFIVHVDEAHQPHRHFGDIREMIETAVLDPRVKSMAIDIFGHIARAEARVHGSTVEKVHFHEVGAVDSIVDIVGAAAAFFHFDARVTCSPVPLGNGTIQSAHGILPVPAPATMFILQGVPVQGSEVQAELTTPTGAAVIKAVVSEFGPYPSMVPTAVGFGAGTRSHPTRPGLLRTVLGDADSGTRGESLGPCCVIETNIDDVTGEVAAHTITTLLEKGALDAWIEPIQMKKGRPAIKVSVLCRQSELRQTAAELFSQCPTIGLRHYPVGRIEMERSIHTIDTPYGPLRIKVARGPENSANAAPEFEDCKQAAIDHDVSLKEVMTVAAGLAQSLIK